jgi:hypothetical protein
MRNPHLVTLPIASVLLGAMAILAFLLESILWP